MIQHLLQPLVCGRFVSDARYRDGHLRVVNALPARHVMGLHSPDMKQLAKRLSREGCDAVMPDGTRRACANGAELLRCFGAVPAGTLCYEETVIWGFLINNEKCTLEERFALLAEYIPVLDNWAVCDSFCAHAKWMARADRHLLWAFLQQWFDSRREFEVRFAIVASMTYLLHEEWLDELFRRIDAISLGSIESEYATVKGKPLCAQQGTVQGAAPYYVRMGVAWLLATALAKFPSRTREYAGSCSLPADVVKLYVRKARESFRTRNIVAMP